MTNAAAVASKKIGFTIGRIEHLGSAFLYSGIVVSSYIEYMGAEAKIPSLKVNGYRFV